MDDESSQQYSSGSLTPERVAAAAIQQAARHEHALRACLAELSGIDTPTRELADSTQRRAMRHAERAISLTRTAIRLNRDPLAQAFLAALLERHERDALLVQRSEPVADGATFSVAG